MKSECLIINLYRQDIVCKIYKIKMRKKYYELILLKIVITKSFCIQNFLQLSNILYIQISLPYIQYYKIMECET